MAEQSTTGTSLYDVGTGVIGDFSVEARASATERLKNEGLERKRQKELNQQKSEQAFAELSKLKSGGWRHHDEHLKAKREEISNWLTEGFQATDGKLFSGKDGNKKRVEYQNKIADFNSQVTYSEQIKSQVESQQELLVKGVDLYTPESVAAHENYMNMTPQEQYEADIPSLQLKKDPVLWENQLIAPTKPNKYTNKKVDAGRSGKASYNILDEELLNKDVDYMVRAAFTEGAGNANHKEMRESYKALYDSDPESDSDQLSIDKDEDGFSDYDRGLMEYTRKGLYEKLLATQNVGLIDKSWRDASAGQTPPETPTTPPVLSPGGEQSFGKEREDWDGDRIGGSAAYESEATIGVDSGEESHRTINPPVIFETDGSVEASGNVFVIPTTGGVIQYGYNFTDLPKKQKEALKKIGYSDGDKVDMLKTVVKKDVKMGSQIVKKDVTVLIPITKAVDDGLTEVSEGYGALKQVAPVVEGGGELD